MRQKYIFFISDLKIPLYLLFLLFYYLFGIVCPIIKDNFQHILSCQKTFHIKMLKIVIMLSYEPSLYVVEFQGLGLHIGRIMQTNLVVHRVGIG